ncbi:DNA polymerase III subunit alpha [Prolixibacteraceae bacterium JC049]|nr:DNA polymerase III subunit alpha [Prolixibacteraceae bacterium JC049]
MVPFTHLHVHSQYSILDGAAGISALVNKAKEDGMKAVALTDHGTMYGIKEFHAACAKAKIKPILGCETYVAARDISTKTERVDRSGAHLVLLAKNEIGYRNLLKLISIANTKGMYYKPRIDKQILKRYSEGIIVCSACLGGEVPQKIMRGDIEGAEETIKWFKDVFGEDYYLELQRHVNNDPRLKVEIYDNQVMVNKEIIQLAKKHDVKIVATNDVHFTNEEDADAHDILICLNTQADLNDPNRMRYTKQEWFKTTEEMSQLFADVPEAVTNTWEIAEKVEEFELDSAPIMPEFPIPEDFGTFEEFRKDFTLEDIQKEFQETEINEEGEEKVVKDWFKAQGGDFEKTLKNKFETEYLSHLTYEGAKVRYGDPIPESVKERLDFELQTIKFMGFPGYFLIVQDFINAARDMGVLVGPGRGSAAGAAVSYCTGITNIDPIKYDLLFERFLNPDRISMPDVDIDFDDDGRQMVLDWVTEKYGQDKVAHICTFGTMAAKLALRDVARVLKLPLPEADRLAKMVPEAPKMTLKKAYKENPELEKEKDSDNPLVAQTIQFAETLEGSVRQTGVHACGILIGRDPLDEHIPLIPTKEEELLTTQYDGRFVEDIGLLKMDFLGLRTLSIIKECIENVRRSHNIEIDIDKIPLDDEKTYELFSRGDTTAIFQFESPGMKKYLRLLKPNRLEDLVAMNALYRPGPIEYIPEFIKRKHGESEIKYDHPMMEAYLKDTYGITVYQEQVMLQSRALGNFTRGESDTLRKAMGKKKMDLMEMLKVKFKNGCLANKEFMEGCDGNTKAAEKLIDKIWKDWEAFASYAFNKSHSVCYAYIAYQTGYLKAHYPAEFMAAVLSRNLSNMDKISIFMDECQRMEMPVLGPDVNESIEKFTVNDKGELRFGMAGIKGVGEGAVMEIIKEREANGAYKDIFDFAERVNLHSVNKKNLEGLAMAGGFDDFGQVKRSQFFYTDDLTGNTFIESLIKYGQRVQGEKNEAQQSLFGMMAGNDADIKQPSIPNIPEWPSIIRLEKEKNLIGIYLSAHPLDDYKLEMDHFTTRGFNIKTLVEQMDNLKGKEITLGGMVTEAHEGMTKNGKPFGKITVSDFSGSNTFFFFGQDYAKFRNYCKESFFLLIKGKVQPRFFNRNQNPQNEQLEFKIDHIEFLHEVRNSRVKSLTLDVPLDQITDEFIQTLEAKTNENGGNALLKFNVIDPKNKMSIKLFSRSIRISLTDEMVQFIQNMNDITFRVN